MQRQQDWPPDNVGQTAPRVLTGGVDNQGCFMEDGFVVRHETLSHELKQRHENTPTVTMSRFEPE
jgi:hypothetical protein